MDTLTYFKEKSHLPTQYNHLWDEQKSRELFAFSSTDEDGDQKMRKANLD